MPVFQHRRNDIYQLDSVQTTPVLHDVTHFMFSDKIVPITTVFHTTKYSYAFTNIRCVVPGRILANNFQK